MNWHALVALFSDFAHTYIFAITCKCWWHTWLQSELTSQWEHSLSWHACVDSGGVKLAQRWGWTMVERFPKLCLHWSCLCWTPGPQDTLHSDHELASQLSEPLSETMTHEYNFTNMAWEIKLVLISFNLNLFPLASTPICANQFEKSIHLDHHAN